MVRPSVGPIFVSSKICNLSSWKTIWWTRTAFIFVKLCRIPIIADLPEDPSKRKKTAESTSAAPSLLDTLLSAGRNRPFNPSVDMMPLLFCSIIDNLPLGCMSQNLLELWKFDEVRIEALSKDDILRAINHTTVSPTTGHDTDFVQLLGDIRRNSTGHIVAASSLLTHWMVYVNFTEVDHSKIGNAAGTEDWVSVDLFKIFFHGVLVLLLIRHLKRHFRGKTVGYTKWTSFIHLLVPVLMGRQCFIRPAVVSATSVLPQCSRTWISSFSEECLCLFTWKSCCPNSDGPKFG